MSGRRNNEQPLTASYAAMDISGRDIHRYYFQRYNWIVKNICSHIHIVFSYSSRRSTVQPVSLLKIIFDGFSIFLGLFIFVYLMLFYYLAFFWIVLSTWLVFKYIVKPVRRPFLCSDLNLYHPKPPENVIPTWLLFVCAIIIPSIIVR